MLSGGATKAFYFHLGVLKALQVRDVTSIVGSSAGAVLGALIASGADVKQIIKAVHSNKIYLPQFDEWSKMLTSAMLFRPQYQNLLRQGAFTAWQGVKFLACLPSRTGCDILADGMDMFVNSQNQVSSFFSTVALEDMLRGLLPTQDFTQLKKDLYIIATDLDSNRRAIFNAHFNAIDAENRFIRDVTVAESVRASTAIPGIFEPVKIKGRYYVDGEVKRTLSADVGARLADTIIISHTYQPITRADNRTVKDLGWVSVIKQAGYIIFYERIKIWEQHYRQQYPNKNIIIITPDPQDETFFQLPQFSFKRDVQDRLIACGELAAKKALEQANLAIEPSRSG